MIGQPESFVDCVTAFQAAQAYLFFARTRVAPRTTLVSPNHLRLVAINVVS